MARKPAPIVARQASAFALRLCIEIVEDTPPAPSRVQEARLILEGDEHLVCAGLCEAVSMLRRDDTAIVAFELVGGGRIAVRRQAVRRILAAPDPTGEPAQDVRGLIRARDPCRRPALDGNPMKGSGEPLRSRHHLAGRSRRGRVTR